MSLSRLEIKVGAFVLMGLILLGVLVVLFSKGTGFAGSSYTLLLKSDNVGGIKSGANALLSGVAVGRVSHVTLEADGKSVILHLDILKKYKIYDDARFDIEQFGFLGDQFVAIRPGNNQGKLLKDGDKVECSPPFNMQDTVAKAAETISRIGSVATNVQQAVSDVRRLVLTENTLTNLAGAVERLGILSARAIDTVSNVNVLVESNSLPISAAVSNLNQFVLGLGPVATRASLLISNNEAEITMAVQNLNIASIQLTNLMYSLETQKGLAGKLLNDPQLAKDFADLAYNLSITTSNLNRRGLWSILWKQKEPPAPKTNAPH